MGRHERADRGVGRLGHRHRHDEFASAVGLDTNSGAFVHTLTLGPFKSARVQPGDVIRAVDGREIRSAAELLDAASTGTPRTIEVWRNQAPVVLTA